MKLSPAATFSLFALSAACSSTIVDPGGSTTGSSSTSGTTTSTTSETTTTTSTETTTGTETTTTTTETTTTTTTSPTPCGNAACTASQLCVTPVCRHVVGEECYPGDPAKGVCPPGTKRGPQFDADCSQPAFACVDGCPPAAPFCLDIPAACAGTVTCACLGVDPCMALSGGVCHDASIADGNLACSLQP